MQMLRPPSPKTLRRFPTRVRLFSDCFALNYSSRAPLESSHIFGYVYSILRLTQSGRQAAISIKIRGQHPEDTNPRRGAADRSQRGEVAGASSQVVARQRKPSKRRRRKPGTSTTIVVPPELPLGLLLHGGFNRARGRRKPLFQRVLHARAISFFRELRDRLKGPPHTVESAADKLLARQAGLPPKTILAGGLDHHAATTLAAEKTSEGSGLTVETILEQRPNRRRKKPTKGGA